MSRPALKTMQKFLEKPHGNTERNQQNKYKSCDKKLEEWQQNMQERRKMAKHCTDSQAPH